MKTFHGPTFGTAVFLYLLLFLTSALEEGEITSKVKFPPSSSPSFPRLVMVGTLPDLQEITLCYWFKVNHLKSTLTIFSYNTAKNDNELLTSLEKQGAFHMNVHGAPQLKVQCPNKIHIGKWHHVCHTWSSWEGEATIGVDGFHCKGNATGIAMGVTLSQGGLVVLGQEQDSVGGEYDAEQSLEGELSELNLWNTVLNHEQIKHLSKCAHPSERHIHGNIIQWDKTQFQAYDGVVLSPNEICA
uniref:C-reactive protein 1.4 n=1 Tax=Limulus polyphemus TaxID=6850 RepID=CRP4_LIMPO|nr:RecName: Full=C-reactive protein 1.4; Flags: Precursor [Limulus polyphemus]AAA28268.1 C-reactive protein precursor [Limulus polyphemus]